MATTVQDILQILAQTKDSVEKLKKSSLMQGKDGSFLANPKNVELLSSAAKIGYLVETVINKTSSLHELDEGNFDVLLG